MCPKLGFIPNYQFSCDNDTETTKNKIPSFTKKRETVSQTAPNTTKKHGSTNTNKTCVYNAKVKGYNVWRRMKLTGPYVISPHVGGSTSYLQSLLKPYLVKEMKDNRNWAHSKMHTNVGTGGEPWDRTHPWQLGIPSSRNVIVSATATCGFVSFEGRGKNALRKVPGYLKGTPNSLRYLGSSLFRPTLTDNDANVHLIFIFTRWCLDPS